jgi:phenol 2-monooxygenase
LAAWLQDAPESPLNQVPDGVRADDWFDVKVIYQEHHTDIDLGTVPKVFLPRVGPFDLVDYEKVYAVHPEVDVFEERGIDRDGAIIVVRPDQYVAHVLPLTATAELAAFFDGVMGREATTPA